MTATGLLANLEKLLHYVSFLTWVCAEKRVLRQCVLVSPATEASLSQHSLSSSPLSCSHYVALANLKLVAQAGLRSAAVFLPMPRIGGATVL